MKILARTTILGAMLQLAACTNLPERVPPSVRLYTIDCGHVEFTDLAMFSTGDEFAGTSGTIVNPCYLIRHPSGDLIWDTGFPESFSDHEGGIVSELQPATMFMSTKLSVNLAKLGLVPSDIEFVALSHWHPDHSGNAGLFARATWIVDDTEYATMFSEEMRHSEFFPAYEDLEYSKRLSLPHNGELDIFGDGSVVAKSAPGHTDGHAILLLQLREAGSVIISGDLWHLPRSQELGTVPAFNVDPVATKKSMAMTEQLFRERQGRLIRQHVPDDFASLPRFPAALE